MKNQTSNGRVSHFDAITPTDEEEIPQYLNKEREASRIFYKRRKTPIHRAIIKIKGKDLMLKYRIIWGSQNILTLIIKHPCIT